MRNTGNEIRSFRNGNSMVFTLASCRFCNKTQEFLQPFKILLQMSVWGVSDSRCSRRQVNESHHQTQSITRMTSQCLFTIKIIKSSLTLAEEIFYGSIFIDTTLSPLKGGCWINRAKNRFGIYWLQEITVRGLEEEALSRPGFFADLLCSFKVNYIFCISTFSFVN